MESNRIAPRVVRVGELFRSSLEPVWECNPMSKLLRGAVAGVGAWKLGGGCFTTILIFIVLWWLLGNFAIFQ